MWRFQLHRNEEARDEYWYSTQNFESLDLSEDHSLDWDTACKNNHLEYYF